MHAIASAGPSHIAFKLLAHARYRHSVYSHNKRSASSYSASSSCLVHRCHSITATAAMKTSKSLSNWMSSALKKPPLPTSTSISTHQLSQSSGSAVVGGGVTGRIKQTVKNNSTTDSGDLADEPDMPWCQKHSPVSLDELAVHKKKVAEVQQWLEYALSSSRQRGSELLLLLVGPPGCGKTATVRALAREMGCTILEWANPVTDVGGSDADPSPGDLVVYAESQAKQFQSFLVRANRYPSLQLGGASGCGHEKKIVLVEDFPNAFMKDPQKFHEIVRLLAPSLHHPLVFIVSESHQRHSSAHSIFSKSHNPIDIYTINFNPVAHTALVKTLLRIANSECNTGPVKSSKKLVRRRPPRGGGGGARYQLPQREVIEQLAEGSVGDIRSAINALQFTCRTGEGSTTEVKGHRSVRLKRTRSGSSSSGVKLKRHTSSDGGALAAVGGRDHSLFLFRALGKIFYCKREGRAEGEGGKEEPLAPGVSLLPLPPHLQQHERSRLLVDPEWVIEHTHLSPEMFTLYLHQNYLSMHSHIENVVRASEYLSGSDVISTLWTDSQPTRAILQSLSCSLASRGLIHTSEHMAGGGGTKWRPLHKPQWNIVRRKYHENCQTAKRLFLHLGQSPHAHLWTPVELQTEILPHLALTNQPLRNPDQAALLQSITHFSHSYTRSHVERLGERDTESVELTLEQNSSLETTATDHGHRQRASQDCGGGSLFHSVSQDVGMGPVDSTDQGEEIEEFEDDVIW